MNEEALNTSVRKFLKKVGITSQREIEKAVRDAVAKGTLKGNEALTAKATISLEQAQSVVRDRRGDRARMSQIGSISAYDSSPVVSSSPCC